MLKTLAQKLFNLGKEQPPFDPSQFNDPLALKIDWSSAKRGGTNFQTRELIKITPYRVEFRATKFALFLYSAFFLGGIGTLIVTSFIKYRSHQWVFNLDDLAPMLIAVAFLIAGNILLYFGMRPIIFDKMKSAFWKGRKSPAQVHDPKLIKDFVRFSDIHALQLISEYIRAKNSYYSYELNIIKKDGTRVNVVDHGNKTKLKQDARNLAMFLNKPVWDAIS